MSVKFCSLKARKVDIERTPSALTCKGSYPGPDCCRQCDCIYNNAMSSAVMAVAGSGGSIEDFLRWAVREHRAVDYCGEYRDEAEPRKPWWKFWR